jgi:hypothetical protein
MKPPSNPVFEALLKHPASNARRMPDALLDACLAMPLRTAYFGLRTSNSVLRFSVFGFRFPIFVFVCKAIYLV